MIDRLYRTTAFALYQFSVAAGILFLPLAVLARQAGVPVPVHRLLKRLEAAYADAESGS